jgi:hypothetical protein
VQVKLTDSLLLLLLLLLLLTSAEQLPMPAQVYGHIAVHAGGAHPSWQLLQLGPVHNRAKHNQCTGVSSSAAL